METVHVLIFISCVLLHLTAGCPDGFWGEDCNNQCIQYCLKCEVINTCKKCKPGYFLSLDKKCLVCPSVCKTCRNRNKCDECFAGFYRDKCSSQCSNGCKDGLCDQWTGQCQCKIRYTGQKCEKCIDGKYGDLCSYNCSTGCIGSLCEKNNGSCTCKANFMGLTCDHCTYWNFGKDCDQTCNQTCGDTRCNRLTGECNNLSSECPVAVCEECNKAGYIAAVTCSCILGLTTVLLTGLLCYIHYFKEFYS